MMDELDFIQSLRALATHPAARGLDDDAAVLDLGTETLVLTQDSMVEGVHYLPGQDMADVAWKLVAVNLSDLAAKGALPLGVLYTHMLGAGDERFVAGLRDVLAAYDTPLLGGDTVGSGPFGGVRAARSFSLTAIGRASCTPVPSRSGAKAGESLFITGPVGAAMMGFEAMEAGMEEGGSAYRRPVPLLAEGRSLAPYASAMMDVSDGLLLDTSRLARASGVTIDIAVSSVPIAAPETRRQDAMRWGDDYQLLFTGPESADWPVEVCRIGAVLRAGETPVLVDGEALAPDKPLGYRHSG